MQEGLSRDERITNQMLALARDATVTRDVLAFERVDLGEVVQGVLRTLWPAARQKMLDVDIKRADAPIWV